MDSMKQVVQYQRGEPFDKPLKRPFEVRNSVWGSGIGSLGNSIGAYIKGYKGMTSYIGLIGIQGKTGVIPGVLTDLLSGSQSKSNFFTELVKLMQDATQFALNNGGITLALDWVHPSGDGLQLANTFCSELVNSPTLWGHSATVSGQFEVDIQNAISPNPFRWLDPKPVFN